MEAIVGLTMLGLMGWGAYKAVEGTVRGARRRSALRQHGEASSRMQHEQDDRQQQAYRQQQARSRAMQLAVLNLDRAPDPDFRRAAAQAQGAREVPVSFRQRQYHRLRPLLVQHYRRCRGRGTSSDVLLESLTELVEALGMQEYEADYVRQEAERTLAVRPTATNGTTVQDFQQRLSQLQQEHDQRVQAIRSLASLADDVREQLLEAEDQRFQSQLFSGRET